MRRVGSLFLAVMLLVGVGSPFLASAQTPDASAEAGLAGTTWELVSIESEAGAPVMIDIPGNYTLSFMDDGQLIIGADCNTALSSYTQDGDAITILPGPTTLMYCGDESHSNAFLISAEAATSVTTDESGNLVLTPASDAGEGAGVLVLQRSLQGTVWQWDLFQSSDESEIAPEDPTRFTVEFIDSETVVIGADCNRGRGVYSRNGSEIDIEILLLTRAYCGDESLDTQFISMLDEATSFVFQDGGLHLALPMDAGIMSFSPMPYDNAEDQG